MIGTIQSRSKSCPTSEGPSSEAQPALQSNVVQSNEPEVKGIEMKFESDVKTIMRFLEP